MNRKILPWAVALYFVLSLGSMATMGIGAALLGLALVFAGASTQRTGTGLTTDFCEDVRGELRRPASRRYLWVALALFAAIAASLVSAQLDPLQYGGVGAHVRFFADLAKSWYLFWPLVLVLALRRLTAEERATAVRAWLWTFGILGLMGIQQFFTGWPRPQPIPFYVGHFHATLFLGHHLSVASILIFPFFGALDLAGKAEGPRFVGISRRMLAAIAAVGLLCLFNTYSRTLWVALPIGILVWILWSLPKRPALVLASIGLLVAIGLASYGPVAARLHNAMGLSERQELWEANFEFLRARPFFGVGWHQNIELSGAYLMQKHPGRSVFSGHAHNTLLDVLAGLGFAGSFAWLSWVGYTLWLLWQETRSTRPGFAHPNFARGLFCAWIVFQINGLTQVNFWEAKVLHQMMIAVAWSLLWAEGESLG